MTVQEYRERKLFAYGRRDAARMRWQFWQHKRAEALGNLAPPPVKA